MKLNFLLFLFTCLSYFGSDAQHDLQAQFIRNATETVIYLNPVSEMFEGQIEGAIIRVNELNSGQDGDVSATLVGYDGVADTRVCLLKNDPNRYCIRLTANGGYIEEFKQEVPNTDFKFQQGDTFQVSRCTSKIIYYQNGRLMYVTELGNDNDVLLGVVQAESADDLNWSIQFIPQ